MDQNMLRKMQKLQKELELKNEEFMEQEFKASKHGVTIVVKGSKKIVSIRIEDSNLLDPEDPEIIEDVILLLLNELFEEIDEKQQALMPNMPSGFGF
ncbi:YbaB/EbfC family nucleoid-associated protein [Mycoplasmopsis bovis]|uniref:YbaB/EbfC family nucleoid-associated protein n=1 Tax=Mycoplasmopsis bovis TaxID=28903 RepID=UPI0010C49C59|nr:YbaB/EbfC family nucleoid-associated protein [Mycoplasmopsis bovis]MBT1323133.1 nucleoid-associated protein [Mycoplasmopsis bovis]QQH18908.1 YbaB/EbfC family nucleoid-associated protein [Mycoplasmopsis bovis]QQH19133.1 YbaB/EbfC family nucleoid-associated protein [Mycoplasmopsis bovis]QQH19370.1 YbaB/EbfC family nucleoid-associated protein [Mycoplasmopsis bovis]QQH19579.1 YbaB/EbfC family nucleoid-associated protein [Mycoplasmopsis bovis]